MVSPLLWCLRYLQYLIDVRLYKGSYVTMGLEGTIRFLVWVNVIHLIGVHTGLSLAQRLLQAVRPHILLVPRMGHSMHGFPIGLVSGETQYKTGISAGPGYCKSVTFFCIYIAIYKYL